MYCSAVLAHWLGQRQLAHFWDATCSYSCSHAGRMCCCVKSWQVSAVSRSVAALADVFPRRWSRCHLIEPVSVALQGQSSRDKRCLHTLHRHAWSCRSYSLTLEHSVMERAFSWHREHQPLRECRDAALIHAETDLRSCCLCAVCCPCRAHHSSYPLALLPTWSLAMLERKIQEYQPVWNVPAALP